MVWEQRVKRKVLWDRIAREADVKKEDILGSDLYVYNRMQGSVWGSEDEFISIGKLDDLECVYSSMTSFLSAEEQDRIPVHCVYDNEEVGSSTRQGAASTFLGGYTGTDTGSVWRQCVRLSEIDRRKHDVIRR